MFFELYNNYVLVDTVLVFQVFHCNLILYCLLLHIDGKTVQRPNLILKDRKKIFGNKKLDLLCLFNYTPSQKEESWYPKRLCLTFRTGPG